MLSIKFLTRHFSEKHPNYIIGGDKNSRQGKITHIYIKLLKPVSLNYFLFGLC